MDHKSEQELFKTLGRIETKMTTICDKNKEQSTDIKDVAKECNKKVTWAWLVTIISAIFILTVGSYTYTFKTTDKIHDSLMTISERIKCKCFKTN